MEFNLLVDFRPGLAIPAVSHPRQVDDGEGIHYGRYKITRPYSQDVPKGMPSAGYMYVSLYTAGLKVRMPIWWRQVDLDIHFRVPREKFGRHSNPIYLVLKPLNKSGTAF